MQLDLLLKMKKYIKHFKIHRVGFFWFVFEFIWGFATIIFIFIFLVFKGVTKHFTDSKLVFKLSVYFRIWLPEKYRQVLSSTTFNQGQCWNTNFLYPRALKNKKKVNNIFFPFSLLVTLIWNTVNSLTFKNKTGMRQMVFLSYLINRRPEPVQLICFIITPVC